MTDGARLVEFLLVQDDPADEVIAREDFAAFKVVNPVLAFRDGRSALAHLDGAVSLAEPRIPDVVLLDLNLPWPGGEAFLRTLRSRPELAGVAVLLLVDSPAAEEIVRARDLPVQGYVRKPLDFACLVAVVRSLAGVGFEVRAS